MQTTCATMDAVELLRKRRRRFTVTEKLAYLRDQKEALVNGTVRNMREFASHYNIPGRRLEGVISRTSSRSKNKGMAGRRR